MKNKKYQLQKDFVFLTVSMFITVCLWIGFSLYDAYVTSTIDETLQLQIIPIEGQFDLDTLQQLKNRKTMLPDYSSRNASGEASLSAQPDVSPPASTTKSPVDITESTLPTPTEVAP